MTGTRIFVFHVRQIIKASAFVVVGLIALASLLYFIVARDSVGSTAYAEEPGLFVPGTYHAEVLLGYKHANVAVTVTEDEITSIVLEELTQNQEILYPLLRPTMYGIAQEIIENQNLYISSNFENAVTSQVLMNAIARALEQGTPQ